MEVKCSIASILPSVCFYGLPVHMHGGLICSAFCLPVCGRLQNNTRKKNHISESIPSRVTKFGIGMCLDVSLVDLECQGHCLVARRVTCGLKVKGHNGQVQCSLGQGQSSQGSRSNKSPKQRQVGSHQCQVASCLHSHVNRLNFFILLLFYTMTGLEITKKFCLSTGHGAISTLIWWDTGNVCSWPHAVTVIFCLRSCEYINYEL